MSSVSLSPPIQDMEAPSLSLVEKYGASVPRYTSYPTAPHFHDGIGSRTYQKWLRAIPGDDSVSLYLHIPYCDRLCWFCGCHTKQTLRYEPIANYLLGLHREIELIAAQLTTRPRVTAIHLGGGSPSMLRPDDLRALFAKLRSLFAVADDAEISIEIDPDDITPHQVRAMAEIGLTRASIGVQDFDPAVQQAINRPQSFALTQSVVQSMREAGVRSVNLDVLYGLPLQTETKIADTIAKVVSLAPDRVALFGYAHVPWMKKHQQMINTADLADLNGRFAQAELAASALVAAGYERVGFDHFAKPTDQMAQAMHQGSLRRNFQGYTYDPASILIGLGASAIGEIGGGYVQNNPATGQYLAVLERDELPIVKGYALSGEDKARRWVIERLMCDLELNSDQICAELGAHAGLLLSEAEALAKQDEDGLFVRAGADFAVTEKGRPFVRVLAAHFDAYLTQNHIPGQPRHSVAV